MNRLMIFLRHLDMLSFGLTWPHIPSKSGTWRAASLCVLVVSWPPWPWHFQAAYEGLVFCLIIHCVELEHNGRLEGMSFQAGQDDPCHCFGWCRWSINIHLLGWVHWVARPRWESEFNDEVGQCLGFDGCGVCNPKLPNFDWPFKASPRGIWSMYGVPQRERSHDFNLMVEKV